MTVAIQTRLDGRYLTCPYSDGELFMNTVNLTESNKWEVIQARVENVTVPVPSFLPFRLENTDPDSSFKVCATINFFTNEMFGKDGPCNNIPNHLDIFYYGSSRCVIAHAYLFRTRCLKVQGDDSIKLEACPESCTELPDGDNIDTYPAFKFNFIQV
jgi:hypothetical protein